MLQQNSHDLSGRKSRALTITLLGHTR